MRQRFGALVLLVLCRVCAAQTPDNGANLHWVGSWGTAQQLAAETLPVWVVPPPREPNEPPPPPLLPPYPASFSNQTVRMNVRTSIGGDGLRLTLSNALGMDTVRIGAVHVALRERDSAIVAATDRAVTFGGRTSLSVEPGALVVSDTVALAVPALTELAVSLYLPDETRSVTTHEFALNTTYVAAGNVAAAAALPNSAQNRTYFWLTGVEVLAPTQAGAIVAFGDSITDGVSTTSGTHRAWPALLAAKNATRDPEQPARLKPDLDSGDHIHPNDAGNAAMAGAIDTTIFTR